MGGTPYNGLYGEALPKRGTFFRLQVYERVGISLVEVYERVGKSVIVGLTLKNFVAVKKSKKCSGCVFYKKEPNNDVRECSFCYCRSFVAIFWYQVGNNQDYYNELLCIFKTNCHLYYQNVHQKRCCHGNKAKEKGYIQGSRKFYLKNSGPSRN